MSGAGPPRTNRDLYLFVVQLAEDFGDSTRSLEEYLRTLLVLTARHRETDVLPLPLFASLLEGAFKDAVPPPDAAWSHRGSPSTQPQSLAGYAGWEAKIIEQILDLARMRDGGMLTNDLRYFGVPSPRGSWWFNFDPCGFLECAVQGTFGGWREGDASERRYVPGLAGYRDEGGGVSYADPRTLPDPIVEIAGISWVTFSEFLTAGQIYE